MEEEILSFIKRRWNVDAHWCTGNCWWFASILLDRFSKYQLKRYYLPIEGHFVVGDGVTFYDWTGKLELEETPYEWEELCKVEPNWTASLITQCKM